MLSFEEAKNVLSLHERDGSLYVTRAVEDFDYTQQNDTPHHEELFIHSSTALLNRILHASTDNNDVRAEAWSVIHEWLVEQETNWSLEATA